MSPFKSILTLLFLASAAMAEVDDAFIGEKLGNLAADKIPGVSGRAAIMLKRADPVIATVRCKFKEFRIQI